MLHYKFPSTITQKFLMDDNTDVYYYRPSGKDWPCLKMLVYNSTDRTFVIAYDEDGFEQGAYDVRGLLALYAQLSCLIEDHLPALVKGAGGWDEEG